MRQSWLVTTALSIVLAASTAAAQPFTLQELGTLGGLESRAYAVNEWRQVAGSAHTPNGLEHAFLWLPEPAYGLSVGMHDLGTLGGAISAALGINDLGHVVGWAQTPSGVRNAFMWLPQPAYGLPAGMNNLGALPGLPWSRASGINNSGRVIGDASEYFGTNGHAFIWEGGAMREIHEPGLARTLAHGVSHSGIVVGEYYPPPHGFSYTDEETIQDLGALGYASYALDVNDHRDIVGSSTPEPGGGYVSAVLWLFRSAYGFGPGIHDLGKLEGGRYSQALAINRFGRIVGVSDTPDLVTRAVMWVRGAIRDLSTQVRDEDRPLLFYSSAWDINSAGAIVGYRVIDYQYRRAILLNPRIVSISIDPGEPGEGR